MPQAENTGLTLTDLTYFGRQTVKFGSIIVVTLIVGRVLLGAFISYWEATHPAPPPPPTVGFGLLPAVVFPPQTGSDKPTSYTLETPSGTTPDYGDRAKVFFMPPSAANLLADEQAKQVAAAYGFVFEPESLDTRTYRWTKSQPLESVLEMDIQNYDLTLSTDYLSRPELLGRERLPDNYQAVTQVKSYLSQVDLLAPDLATAPGEVVYLKSLGGQLQEAVSYSDADFIQVDLNRAPIDSQFRMYTPLGLTGVVNAIITSTEGGGDGILQLEYHYHPVDYSVIHTYPLRTSQSAWKLLQAGEGYIADKGSGDQAIIRQVGLGYYDSFAEQEYLQPIYVFIGDGGFIGYIPALDPKYVQGGVVGGQ